VNKRNSGVEAQVYFELLFKSSDKTLVNWKNLLANSQDIRFHNHLIVETDLKNCFEKTKNVTSLGI